MTGPPARIRKAALAANLRPALCLLASLWSRRGGLWRCERAPIDRGMPNKPIASTPERARVIRSPGDKQAHPIDLAHPAAAAAAAQGTRIAPYRTRPAPPNWQG